MGARRTLAEVQVIVMRMVVTVVMVMAVIMTVVVVMAVAVRLVLEPRPLALTASAYRAHGVTSEPVIESPAAAAGA